MGDRNERKKKAKSTKPVPAIKAISLLNSWIDGDEKMAEENERNLIQTMGINAAWGALQGAAPAWLSAERLQQISGLDWNTIYSRLHVYPQFKIVNDVRARFFSFDRDLDFRLTLFEQEVLRPIRDMESTWLNLNLTNDEQKAWEVACEIHVNAGKMASALKIDGNPLFLKHCARYLRLYPLYREDPLDANIKAHPLSPSAFVSFNLVTLARHNDQGALLLLDLIQRLTFSKVSCLAEDEMEDVAHE